MMLRESAGSLHESGQPAWLSSTANQRAALRSTLLSALADHQARAARPHAKALCQGWPEWLATEEQAGGDLDGLAARYLRDTCSRLREDGAAGDGMLPFCLQSLGRVAARHLEGRSNADAAWRELALEDALAPLLVDADPFDIRLDALRCLAAALAALPPQLAARVLQARTVSSIYRSAVNLQEGTWTQCEALSLLEPLNPGAFMRALHKRLSTPQAGDDLFVRRHAVDLLAPSLRALPDADTLVATVLRDPSAFVRQGLAQVLARAPTELAQRCWPALGLRDPDPAVRAAAALQLPLLAARPELFDVACESITTLLRTENASFALRAGLLAAERGTARLAGEARRRWAGVVMREIEHLHTSCAQLPVRRWAAETRERIWGMQTRVVQLAERLRQVIDDTAPGKASALPVYMLDVFERPAEAGRVLALLAQEEHSLALQRDRNANTAVLWRGERPAVALGRVLQGWRQGGHRAARPFMGSLRAPAALAAKAGLAAPSLQHASEAGWRPYLPLVDDFLGLLDDAAASSTLRLYTAEGVTELRAPDSESTRKAARAQLRRDFATYADERNWCEGSATHPARYLRQMEQLGFACRFKPHRGTQADPAVMRFFPAVLAQERVAAPFADNGASVSGAAPDNGAVRALKRALLDAHASAGAGKAGAGAMALHANPVGDLPEWLEAGLVTSDILARFAYHEHPANIAHVARLGAELGIAADFALKAMADHVQPDARVLRTCAPKVQESRTLVCANGLYADDADACLDHWQRLGLAAHDMLREPGTVISTVIDARGVPARGARKLADLLVRTLHADLHIVIGSTPTGLRAAWDAYAATLTLWPELAPPGGPAAELHRLARRARVVASCAQLQARLRIMLAAIGAPERLVRHRGDPAALAAALGPLGLELADELLAFHQFDLDMLQQFEALEEQCRLAGEKIDYALDMAMRAQFETWFQQRLILIDDAADNDSILAALCKATPPGFCNRSMGPVNLDDGSAGGAGRFGAGGRLARSIDSKLRAVRAKAGG